MPKTVRLSKEEESGLYRKCVELNKVLITKNKLPIRESELIHYILEKAIKNVRLDEKGEIYIDV